MPPEHADKPLLGVRVLDLTRLLPGPVASLRLAEMGAEVIKIEEPGLGDYARTLGPTRNEISQLFISANRGKQSLRLNLKESKDKETFLKMVTEVDIVMESFRPGVMKKLGLAWNTLRTHNPRLVMCSISGYGQNGPLSLSAGHDLNYIALSGVLEQNSLPNGKPSLPNLQIGDLLGGAQTAVQGILAALVAVKMGGHGRYVDVSMADAVLANNIMPRVNYNAYSPSPTPGRDLLTGGAPCYNLYRTKDDRYLAVGALEHKFWKNMCDAIKRTDLYDRHWMCGLAIASSDSDALQEELEQLFLTQTLSQWVAVFDGFDCCISPVLRIDEALQHPHFLARCTVFSDSHESEGGFIHTTSGMHFLW